MDRISDLPDIVIEKILLCMPLLDAVRTTVLSQMWHDRWTLMPRLILDVEFFLRIRSITESPFDYLHIVHSLLLQHKGPLEEYYLVIPEFTSPRRDYVNQSLRIVLMRGVKKLTVLSWAARAHNWPSSFPISRRLTYLELTNCELKRQPSLRSFINLNSLVFDHVRCDPDTLSSLISHSPNLQRIKLQNLEHEGHLLNVCAPKLEYLFVRGKFKSIHLQSAQNLREMELELHLRYMSEYSGLEMPYLIDFFASLVRLESLRLGSQIYKMFVLAGLLTKLPRGFGELKVLKLADVDFNNIGMLHCILCFIRTSPNLCRLEIRANPLRKCESGEELHLKAECYEHCSLKHLERVYIGPIMGRKTEMEIIEFLLRRSPALQVMSIWQGKGPNRAATSRVSKALMKFPRASASARIHLSYQYWGPFSEA